MTMRAEYGVFFVVFVAGVVLPARAQPTNLEVAFPALTFDLAVDLQNAADGTDRLFAVEQAGVVKVFENDPVVAEAAVFLDIRDRVLSNDRFGLLGLAFHPNYADNGFFFIHYTASEPSRSVIARYTVSPPDADQADRASEVVFLEVEQPHKFHNGGQLAFGPEGYLYIGLGDGGPGRDPSGHGQNRQTLLGSMVRIDVDTASPGLAYSIPPDNPFVSNTEGFREEIWAWGFRNPWRFSFDPETQWLWTADNGEDRFEEIDIVEKGANYGWKIMEASACFSPSIGCDTAGLTLPIWEYGGSSTRRSVIGGYVYRGRRNPELAGRYLYADFLTGQGWALTYDGTQPAANSFVFAGFQGIAAFGLDEHGEVYLSNILDGKIYRFVPTATPVEEPAEAVREVRLAAPYPNPFARSTVVGYQVPRTAHVRLTVYDMLGRAVALLVDGVEGPGRHEVRVETDGLPAGVYVCRMEAAGTVQARTFVVLK